RNQHRSRTLKRKHRVIRIPRFYHRKTRSAVRRPQNLPLRVRRQNRRPRVENDPRLFRRQARLQRFRSRRHQRQNRQKPGQNENPGFPENSPRALPAAFVAVPAKTHVPKFKLIGIAGRPTRKKFEPFTVTISEYTVKTARLATCKIGAGASPL